ncbi:hypothetical protein HOLleu_38998 [Holothuria leucospilota]|uniref:Uncharacterized protein n=1 Tax=Holothuria leucospilota TaxID=206669 RepID=A0A9Q0YK68_HOLLE|nr:hypothetical protein HOLleu_38998 [Holothuria leucospilota]
MGCTLSKVSNNIEKETSTGQKSHQNGLRHWVGKKRQAFIRLVRPSHFTPPQSEDHEKPPKEILQKPQLRRRERRVTSETLDQNGPEKRATRRHHVKEVLSSSEEDIPQDNHSRHRIGKTLVRKQTPYQPFDDKHQEDVYSSDASQLYEAEEEPDDDTPSICQLDITPEGCEWCEVIRRSERLAVLRRKAKYKRKQRGETVAKEDGWDSEEEQRAYLAGKEWQEKRKRIDKWVEDGIREMKAKELRKMKKKLKGAVRQKQDKVEDEMKIDFKGQSEYLEEMIMKREEVGEVVREAKTEQQLRKGEDEESVEGMMVKPGMGEKKTVEPRRYLEMEKRSKEEERQREEIKKAASAKMEKYFAARLEMRMQAVSERVEAEAEREGENVLQRFRQMRMEEKRHEVEMEAKKREEIQTRKETESKGTKDPFNRVSFDFEDSVDELTRRKVKKTGGTDPRQKESEKVKGKRGHVDPMEELDVAINELLAKDDVQFTVAVTVLAFRWGQVEIPGNWNLHYLSHCLCQVSPLHVRELGEELDRQPKLDLRNQISKFIHIHPLTMGCLEVSHGLEAPHGHPLPTTLRSNIFGNLMIP